MSMRFTRGLAFCLALMPPGLRAADWISVSSDYESSIYYDRDSLKRNGAVVEVLLLWDFAQMQLTRRPVKPYLSATRLTRFDCGIGGRARGTSRKSIARLTRRFALNGSIPKRPAAKSCARSAPRTSSEGWGLGPLTGYGRASGIIARPRNVGNLTERNSQPDA